MSVSSHNDDVFAKFMINLAKKMIVREDTRIEAHERMKAHMASLSAHHHSSGISSAGSGILQLAAQYAYIPGNPLMTDSNYGPRVTDEELAVIRAYHNGEDVLLTLLSQER